MLEANMLSSTIILCENELLMASLSPNSFPLVIKLLTSSLNLWSKLLSSFFKLHFAFNPDIVCGRVLAQRQQYIPIMTITMRGNRVTRKLKTFVSQKNIHKVSRKLLAISSKPLSKISNKLRSCGCQYCYHFTLLISINIL